MFPIVWKDIPFIHEALHTYGLMNALAFVVGAIVSVREGKRVGIPAGKMLDIIFWAAVGGFVGARILFIIVNLNDYIRNPMALFSLRGGLVFYGGFILALFAIAVYLKKNNLNFFVIADILAPQIALGHALGRIGCFSAGCCWGREADANYLFAARFTHPAGQPVLNNLANVPLHPTQLYEALGLVAIFVILSFWRTKKRFHGEVFLGYLVLYAILRSVDETFRGDGLRGYVIPDIISTSQFIALLIVVIATVIWIKMVHKQAAK